MSIAQEPETLVAQLQKGDEKAFAALYDQYSPSLYGLILKIVKQEDLAQDILQDCFVRIWKNANTYNKEKGSFFTWMLNICRNKSIDELRKGGRKGIHLQVDEDILKTDNSTALNINTIGLKDLVNGLPEEHQLIIEYLYFKGYTQQELSDELDIPLGTVKTRAKYAMNFLRDNFISIILLWILKNT